MSKSFLYEHVIRNAENNPNGIAFYYRKKKEIISCTYREVFEKIAATRTFIIKNGNERFGLLSENSVDFFIQSCAIIAAGKNVALLDPQANIADLVNAIKNTDLTLVYYDEDNQDLISQIKPELTDVVFEKIYIPEYSEEDVKTIKEWEDGCVIYFTSGSTKSSKAVVAPSCTYLGHADEIPSIRNYEKGKSMLVPLPFHHAFASVAIHVYYYLECPIFVSSMKTLLKDLNYAKPTMITLVPSAAEFLLSKDAFNPELKYMFVAGAYLPPSLAEKINQKGITVQNQYGSSEIPSGIGSNLPEDGVDCLTVLKEMDVHISSDGEIIIRTPYHFKEYYKNPEDTAEMIIDGEIHTGDMGFIDEKGKLHLLGRRKNMIIMKNGEKVFYTDIDEALKALNGVADAAVIYRDDSLVAVIAPEAGVSKEQIQAEIDKYNLTQPVSRLIKKLWIYGPSLPYTSSGKMQRSIIEKDWDQGKADL